MSHKLTGEALKYVALNLEKCSKDWINKRVMVVVVSDSSAGSKVCEYLVAAYKPKSYGQVTGWKKFYLRFDYVWQRDQAVEDVNAAVDEYWEAHNTPLTEHDDPTPSDSGDKEEDESDNNLTTYIIIGAAAIIIALLLWKRE